MSAKRSRSTRCWPSEAGTDLKVGTPLVVGRKCAWRRFVAHGKHDKVRIFKMRRRKHYQKRGKGIGRPIPRLEIGAVSA